MRRGVLQKSGGSFFGSGVPVLVSEIGLDALCIGSVARPAGLEPATYGLEGRCTIRLCYERMGPKYATADRSAQVSNTGIL